MQETKLFTGAQKLPLYNKFFKTKNQRGKKENPGYLPMAKCNSLLMKHIRKGEL